jgi:hypothetical protein
VCSNLTGGSEMRDAMEGWGRALEGVGLGLEGLLLLFSDEYMTATLVEGEFMVPVRDQPIAAGMLVFCLVWKVHGQHKLTLTRVDHGRSRYCRRFCTLPKHLGNVVVRALGGQICSPAQLTPPTRTGE